MGKSTISSNYRLAFNKNYNPLLYMNQSKIARVRITQTPSSSCVISQENPNVVICCMQVGPNSNCSSHYKMI
jgi:hypothetical protein